MFMLRGIIVLFAATILTLTSSHYDVAVADNTRKAMPDYAITRAEYDTFGHHYTRAKVERIFGQRGTFDQWLNKKHTCKSVAYEHGWLEYTGAAYRHDISVSYCKLKGRWRVTFAFEVRDMKRLR